MEEKDKKKTKKKKKKKKKRKGGRPPIITASSSSSSSSSSRFLFLPFLREEETLRLQRVIQYPHAKWSGKVSEPQKREDAQQFLLHFFLIFNFNFFKRRESFVCVCVRSYNFFRRACFIIYFCLKMMMMEKK